MIVDLPALALGWHDAGRGVAIATVIETWGSAPRPVGSQMVIDADGAFEGSVSGGCVEGAVVFEAAEALVAGEMRVLEYGVSDDDAFAVGLACGGRIKVLVEPVGTVMPLAVLRDLVAHRAARTPIAYVIDFAGERRLEAVSERRGLSEDARSFVAVHQPQLRMVIVGAVHIAQPLVMMARACGYEVIVVDPRAAFATAVRFPQTRIINEFPDIAFDEIDLDSMTCVVTLSHDMKIDDPAIVAALASDAFYIGALGSVRTHAKRVVRLSALGLDTDRVHGPVGIKLGGRHPAEIAVSIMAQVTQVLHGKTEV